MNFNLFKMIQSLLDHSNTNYLGFNFFLCNCLVHTDYDNFKLFFCKSRYIYFTKYESISYISLNFFLQILNKLTVLWAAVYCISTLSSINSQHNTPTLSFAVFMLNEVKKHGLSINYVLVICFQNLLLSVWSSCSLNINGFALISLINRKKVGN